MSHPTTPSLPVEEDLPLLESDPKKVRGQHYDIVLNGVELGGGSIRIHQPEVQKKVFEDVLKIPPDVVHSRFGYMLEAFSWSFLRMEGLLWDWTAWLPFFATVTASVM